MTADTQTTNRVRLALLENAIDFLRKGVEELHPPSTCGCDWNCSEHKWPEPDHAAAKYAILHVYSGVVLLFKERLRREDPELIYQATPNNPRATVTYHEALKRLRKIGYEVPATDRAMLDTVRGLRNPFEHFEVDVQKEDGERMVAHLLEYAYNFLADHLGVRLEEHVPFGVWLRVKELQTVEARIDAEEAAVRAAWWKGMLTKYANIDDAELERIGEPEAYHPRDNPFPKEFHWCPQCLEETVVVIEHGTVTVCTNKDCRDIGPAAYCVSCGELILETRDFCEYCNDKFFGDDA
jgi:hypothetical protein